MSLLIIQKYGGSVLTDDRSVARAADSIALTVADGSRVVAVVSALASVTNALHDRGCAASPTPGDDAFDLLLATGELQSVALLTLALRARGIDAAALTPWQLGITTDDHAGDARIMRVDPQPVRSHLASSRVVVAPGFVGVTADGRVTTLGRGGSDLTAMALADALSADVCEFFKDVPGYFSADPALVREAVHRPAVTVAEALELSRHGCRFLQDRALEWAASCRAVIRIRALDDPRATELTGITSADAPLITAITHRTAPDATRGLVTLVGASTALASPAFVASCIQVLTAAGIAAHAESAGNQRLTLAVRGDSVAAAERVLHEHLVINPLTVVAS